MGEETRAVAVAIRRPMRRWWLTRGSWWVGAIIVLFVIAFWIQVISRKLWLENGLLNQSLDTVAHLCASVAILLTSLCWIAAALQANASISAAVADFPHPYEHNVKRARLWLCFSQGLALVVLVALLRGVVMYQVIGLQELITLHFKSAETLWQVGPLWYFSQIAMEALPLIWPIPFCMLWFSAILAAKPDRWQLAVPWILPAVIPQALEFIMLVDFQRYAAQGSKLLISSMGRLPYISLPLLWPLGFLLMLLLVWLLGRDRSPRWRLLFVVLLVSVIAYIPNWHSVMINMLPSKEAPGVLAANAMGALSAMALTYPFEYAAYGRVKAEDASGNIIESTERHPRYGTLRVRAAINKAFSNKPNWWSICAFAGNIAWLAAQYFILSILLGWRGSQFKPRGTPPTEIQQPGVS